MSSKNWEFPEKLTEIFLRVLGNFSTIAANFQNTAGMQKMADFINSNLSSSNLATIHYFGLGYMMVIKTRTVAGGTNLNLLLNVMLE